MQNLTPAQRAIGGYGWIIEIDESCVSKKKKYGRGTGGPREDRWIFGMIERSKDGTRGRFLLFPVRNRTRGELFRIINRYVRPGIF